MDDYSLAENNPIAARLPSIKPKLFPLLAQRSKTVATTFGALVALTALAAHASCLPPPAELISWWPLDETSGTAVSDVLNRNPGIATGTIGSSSTSAPKSSAALVGNGLFFPNSQVNVSPSSTLPSGSSSFTIDAWIKTTNNFFFPVVGNFDQQTGKGYTMRVDSNQLTFEIAGSYYWGPAVPDNTWTFIAVVVSRAPNNTVSLCTAPQTSTQMPGPMVCLGFPLDPGASAGNGLPLVIGGCSGGLSDCSVVLDEVEIFSDAMPMNKLTDINNAGAAGKCKPPPPPKGMTWRRMAVNPTTGTVTVGCGSSDPVHPCNPFVGDQLCTQKLPLLCFRPFSPPLLKPTDVDDSNSTNRWSGGIVGTTLPVLPSSINGSLSRANEACQKEFDPGNLGSNWRLAEFHDGAAGAGGWNFQAYGNVGTPANRVWVHINDQPGTCFPNQ